jgi:hypothetical protein
MGTSMVKPYMPGSLATVPGIFSAGSSLDGPGAGMDGLGSPDAPDAAPAFVAVGPLVV